MSEGTFQDWAIVELMGHRRLAGMVSEQQIASVMFIRLDVPGEPAMTQFYSPSAVYCITPTTEPIARKVAAVSSAAPVQHWELPTLPSSEDEYDDETGRSF